jgi:hypothetical protein
MKSTLLQQLVLLCLTPGILSTKLARRTTPAPFHDGGESIVPINNEYVVLLHENHTLENHFDFIGTNLGNHSNFKHLKNINMYRVGIENDTLLHDLVRYDPGVVSVQQNGKAQGLEKKVDPTTPPRKPASRLSRMFRKRWQVVETLVPWNLVMMASWGKLPTPVETDKVVRLNLTPRYKFNSN